LKQVQIFSCTMFKTFSILLLLHIMLISATLTATKKEIEKLTGISLTGSMLEVLNHVGGKDQLEDEINDAIAYASTLHGNIPASLVQIKTMGAAGIVGKICFTDGICWADKMLANPMRIEEAYYGAMAITVVQRYCPNIPTVKLCGYRQGRLQHYFSEWIPGQTLHDKVESNYTEGTSIKIPEKVVTSLAEFVYNLTTCPIPREGSKKLLLSTEN
jgi:hypothetical protein